LHEQLTEHQKETATSDTITQQMNTKLNTLISDLSQHQQQTAAESHVSNTSWTFHPMPPTLPTPQTVMQLTHQNTSASIPGHFSFETCTNNH